MLVRRAQFFVAALSLATALGGCAAQTNSDGTDESTGQDLGGFDRQTVYDEVKGHASAPGDLLRVGYTDDRLVAAIGWMVENGAPPFYISAIRSDHHNDGANAHAGGHCADMYVTNSSDARAFISLASRNPYVAEIGLGGAYKAYRSSVTRPYFNDNDATHLHIGVIHAFGSGGTTSASGDTGSGSSSSGSSGSDPRSGASDGGGCYSNTLGKQMPTNSCVQQSSGAWFQCNSAGHWVDRYSDPNACVAEYPYN
jgi:hypothetical protein